METMQPIARASAYSKALSEEIRIRMLMCMKGGPLGLHHFIDIFGLAPSTLSKHLHVLENAGLAAAVRQGRWRLYQRPDTGADETVRDLLKWLDQAASDDPVLQADAARRAVAIEKNPVPSLKSDLTKVLFLCTGNSCRSQMAEAILRSRGGERFSAASAGVAPRDIPPMTVEVMKEIGIDMAEQKPKSVMQFIGQTHFDYLITVCPMAEEHTPVFPGVTRRLHWPMEDPAEAVGTEEEKKQVFRRVRDQLLSRISEWTKTVSEAAA